MVWRDARNELWLAMRGGNYENEKEGVKGHACTLGRSRGREALHGVLKCPESSPRGSDDKLGKN